MKALVFDTGPLISLTTNNLLWLVEPLKDRFKGSFLIPEAVKTELVDDPLRTKRFKFEALQICHYIDNGTLRVVKDIKYRAQTRKLLDIANNCFKAQGSNITIVHYGEAAAIAAAKELNADSLVIDERVTRELIENPEHLMQLMSHKLHTKVSMNQNVMKEAKKELKGLEILRSAELVTIAFELGLLKRYITNLKEAKKELLEGVLWGVKIDGCAVSEKDIRQIMKMELK